MYIGDVSQALGSITYRVSYVAYYERHLLSAVRLTTDLQSSVQRLVVWANCRLTGGASQGVESDQSLYAEIMNY